MLFLLAFGCAHTPEIAKEAAKQDAAVIPVVSTGVPAVEVPETYHNFGDVSEGTDYVHEFVVRNKGTGVLEIRKVVPG